MPSDGVEPTTECLDEFARVRSGLRRLRCGLPVYGGVGWGQGTRLQMRRDGRRFLHLVLWAAGGNRMHDRRRLMSWWLR